MSFMTRKMVMPFLTNRIAELATPDIQPAQVHPSCDLERDLNLTEGFSIPYSPLKVVIQATFTDLGYEISLPPDEKLAELRTVADLRDCIIAIINASGMTPAQENHELPVTTSSLTPSPTT